MCGPYPSLCTKDSEVSCRSVRRCVKHNRKHDDTMDVIRQFVDEFLGHHPDFIQSDDFIPKARRFAHDIDAKDDRIKFFTLLMQRITKWIEEHRTQCKKNDCGFEKTYSRVNYFLQQELSRLNVVVDKDAFTTSEWDAIHAKLDAILNDLDQLKEGQGIVAQDVEDLKDLMYLGKQKWHRQFVGTVSEWVGAGMVSDAVAKPMVSEMKNAFDQLPGLLGT